MDPLNYWIDKVKLNTEVTTVGALRNVLLAKQNGAKVMTLGGLRQAVDDNHGVHYTSIADMVFSTAYKSDGVSDFTGNQQSWFATYCAVAVGPARREGWENTNRTKLDLSKITELIDDKYLCDLGVGEHGIVIAEWRRGRRKQQGMDWADAGIDIVFDYLGDVL